jgi:hypothetical protein
MPSKATAAARQRDVLRLQVMIGKALLTAEYSESRHCFLILRRTGYVLCAGRFEIVSAYVRGFMDGQRSLVFGPSEPHQVTP